MSVENGIQWSSPKEYAELAGYDYWENPNEHYYAFGDEQVQEVYLHWGDFYPSVRYGADEVGGGMVLLKYDGTIVLTHAKHPRLRRITAW